jgi:hypothetical protein
MSKPMVLILVEGGLVQQVFTDADLDVRLVDLDESWIDGSPSDWNIGVLPTSSLRSATACLRGSAGKSSELRALLVRVRGEQAGTQ